MTTIKNRIAMLIAVAMLIASLESLANEPPQLRLTATEHALHLPDGWYVGEISAIDFDSRGHLYVFNRGAHPLLEFDADGKFIREFGQGLFRIPHGLRVDRDGNIWTTDQQTHQVIKFSRDGRIALVLGRRDYPGRSWYDRGYNVTLLKEPSDVGLDSEDNIYVADAGNFRIVKYSPFGEPLATWGGEGARPGQFNFPHSIAIDSKDRIHVTDRENGRIQVFTTDGRFLEQWDNVGYPYIVELAGDKTIWMTDARSGKVLNLDLAGNVLGSFGQWGKEIGDFGFGHGITVDDAGDVYIGELLNWRIQRLSPTNPGRR